MSYFATSRIPAHLASTQRWGELELEQSYSAPPSLQFQASQFVGDKFVKTNLIVRFLLRNWTTKRSWMRWSLHLSPIARPSKHSLAISNWHAPMMAKHSQL
jgi:hypothetical protein